MGHYEYRKKQLVIWLVKALELRYKATRVIPIILSLILKRNQKGEYINLSKVTSKGFNYSYRNLCQIPVESNGFVLNLFPIVHRDLKLLKWIYKILEYPLTLFQLIVEAEIFSLQSVSPSSQTTSTLSECEPQPIAITGETPITVCRVAAEKRR